MYKIANNLVNIRQHMHLKPAQTCTHGSHQHKYQLLPARTNCMKYSYFPKTVNDWDNLSHKDSQWLGQSVTQSHHSCIAWHFQGASKTFIAQPTAHCHHSLCPAFMVHWDPCWSTQVCRPANPNLARKWEYHWTGSGASGSVDLPFLLDSNQSEWLRRQNLSRNGRHYGKLLAGISTPWGRAADHYGPMGGCIDSQKNCREWPALQKIANFSCDTHCAR